MVDRYLWALPCLLLAACASAGSDSSGAAGTSGASGTTGSAGTSGAGAGFGMGGPFNLPQNKKSGACTITSVGSPQNAVTSAYNAWKGTYVVPGDVGMRVQSPEAIAGITGSTVSEGIGYGMLAATYMADRNTFDGLWAYAKAHFDAIGLMNWHITSAGAIASGGTGSASDGDEDMAWALLMASDQWSSTQYLSDAQTLINNILYNSVANDGMLKPGDAWGSSATTYPDYFSPAYYRAFAKATDNQAWVSQVIERGYTILGNMEGTDGLVPDSTTDSATSPSGTYGYDACRTPWRIAMDYCFNGEPRAQTYLAKIGAFFNGIGANSIGDGYNSATNAVTSSNHNMAFIGPAGVAGMAGYQTLLDGAFNFGSTNSATGGNNAYFPQSLRVITMLMMSGNFLDYSQLQ